MISGFIKGNLPVKALHEAAHTPPPEITGKKISHNKRFQGIIKKWFYPPKTNECDWRRPFLSPLVKTYFFGHTLSLGGEAEVRKWSAKRIPEHPSQTNLSPPDLSFHPAANLVRMKTLPAQLWTCDRRSANSSFRLKLCDRRRQKENKNSTKHWGKSFTLLEEIESYRYLGREVRPVDSLY